MRFVVCRADQWIGRLEIDGDDDDSGNANQPTPGKLSRDDYGSRGQQDSEGERLRDPSHTRALQLTEFDSLFAGLKDVRRAFHKYPVKVDGLLASAKVDLWLGCRRETTSEKGGTGRFSIPARYGSRHRCARGAECSLAPRRREELCFRQ